MAVVVEVAGSDRFPTRPRIGAHHFTADYIRPVHFPDRGLTVRVLPEDVGMAVVVEVACSDRFPTRPRIGAHTAPLITLVPFISQIAAWPSVFCHRMSECPSSLKSPVPIACQLGPGSAPTLSR